MERALPLVASFFSSCIGGHRLPSIPVADRPHPDTSGAEPLPLSRVQIGIAAWDGSALRPTVSRNIDDLDHVTTARRTVPLRTHAVGTPEAPGHAVRVRSNACGPHRRHRILDLASEAARQCAMVRANVVQVQVALLAAAPPLAQFPVMPGDLSPEPWPTAPLFQPPGLQPFAVPAGTYQAQGSTLRVQGAQDKQSRMPGFVEAVLLRTCVILGVPRQTTDDRHHRGCATILPQEGQGSGRMVNHPAWVRTCWKGAMSS